MTLDEATRTLTEAQPPAEAPPLLTALWHEAHGDWPAAHAIAQEIDSVEGAWVHAYLHRREGDTGNAAYWYRRAGRPVCRLPLDEERLQIAAALLHP